MKKFAITLLSITLTFNSFGQDKLFLTVKSDPLVFEKTDYTKGTIIKSVTPSVSSDNKYLSIALTNMKMNFSDMTNTKITYNPMGILINMETGEFIRKVKNSSFFFEENNLMKCDYNGIWDKSIPISDITSALFDNLVYNIVDPSTLEVITNFSGPKNEFYLGTEQGYVKMMKFSITGQGESYNSLYKLVDGKLILIGKYPMTNGTISEDGKLISGALTDASGKSRIVVYNIASGALVKEINLKKDENPISVAIDSKNHIIVSYMGAYNIVKQNIPHGLKIMDLSDLKVIKDFPDEGGTINIIHEFNLLMITQKNGQIKFFDMNSLEFVGNDLAFMVDEKDITGGIPIPVKIGSGKHFLIGHSSGISKLVSVQEKRVIADIFVDEEDWAVVAADGRVDGTSGAFKKLEWRKYSSKKKVIDQISLDMILEKFYTPKLLSQLLNNSIGSSESIYNAISMAPNVKIISPTLNANTSNKDIEVTISVVSNGDPIREIQLFVNNKLIGSDERGFKTAGETQTFTVTLVQGLNQISAKAISVKGFESKIDEIELTYKGEQATANLYIFAIGLNTYQNAAYNLNYAIADANAVVNKLKSNTTGIFKNTFVYTLYDLEANRDGIIAKMSEISKVSQPEDVFIFYYAGHGVMEEISNEFYLALFDVTQLYGKSEILKSKGISSNELKNYFSNIKAQKQLIILDACQSGGAVNTFAMRGAAEEKALVQLARSSGVVLLASTGSEQFATEFKELGHGVFTYALLEGLNGKADGGQKDNKITVKELEAYINDNIPALTDRYKGQAQYPRSWSMGQDFPIVIAK